MEFLRHPHAKTYHEMIFVEDLDPDVAVVVVPAVVVVVIVAVAIVVAIIAVGCSSDASPAL